MERMSYQNEVPENAVKTEQTEQGLKVETVERVTAAENIAKFRMELEDRIFKEGLPKKQWRKAYDQALVNYPDISTYKKLFDLMLSHAEDGNDQIEKLWKKYVKGEKLVDKFNPAVNKANTDASAKLYEKVIGNKPEEEVSAYKGQISIRFMVGNKDFESLGFSREHLPGGAETTMDGDDFSVIFLNRDYEDKTNYIVMHELEHAKNDIFRTERINYPRAHMTFADSNVRRRMERRSLENKDDVSAKEEILAYLAGLEYIPEDYKIDEMGEFLKKIEGSLVSEEGYDLPNRKSISDGFDAFSKLVKLYEEKGSTFQKSARLAINTLEQFPLASWQAVARLLKYKQQK